jgi:hypothetical protein
MHQRESSNLTEAVKKKNNVVIDNSNLK